MADAPLSDDSWTHSIELYCKPEAKELLHETGERIAVKTLLNICRLKFTFNEYANVEYMSPSGAIPITRISPLFFTGFESLVRFLELKEISISNNLDVQKRAEMKAYISLIQDKLLPAELSIVWGNKKNYNKYTFQRYGGELPFPLNYALPWLKKQSVLRGLVNRGLSIKYSDALYVIEQVVEALSNRLGDGNCFYSDRLTELDILAYGHLRSMHNCPFSDLQHLISKYQNLVLFCNRFAEIGS